MRKKVSKKLLWVQLIIVGVCLGLLVEVVLSRERVTHFLVGYEAGVGVEGMCEKVEGVMLSDGCLINPEGEGSYFTEVGCPWGNYWVRTQTQPTMIDRLQLYLFMGCRY